MEKYNKYKDSDIDWLLDEIPSHWETKRIKDLCKMQSGFYISANDFKDEGFPIYGGNGFRGFSEDYNHDGEYTLIGRQGALCGNINYAKGKFWATEHAIVVYEKKGVNKFWFGELLRLMNLNQYSLSAAQPGLSVEKIKRLKLPFIPLLKEQTQIANYLDAKTTAIDKKIRLLQQKIKHYKAYRKTLINETVTKGLDKTVKLKDSGVNWIGEIPEHWEVKRLKDLSAFINGYAFNSKEYVDTGIPIIRISNISNEIDFKKCKYVNSSYLKLAKDSLLINDDILVAMTGATIGKNSMYNNKRKALLNQRVGIIRAKKSINNLFLFQIIKSQIFKDYIDLLCGGSAQENISKTQIENFYIQLPPIKEQQQIADYLDAKTSTIDKIVKNIENQIIILKELRKTLINEVVTGKAKVSA